jgi:anti-sigma regulatory factor (Ser/Thr protein kinase)
MSVHAHQQASIPIADRSCIGEARRLSAEMAERARLRTADSGRVPLIVSELATNLLLHAHGGEILLRIVPVECGPGVEIIAVDRGPGIPDLRRCMTDGYSSVGTRGCGLGAVRRLSTEFDIYSRQPAGTVVLSRVRNFDAASDAHIEFSAISAPAPNEIECGDAWYVRHDEGRLSAIVVDGLGHGPLAALAATEALRVFIENSFDSPVRYLDAAHAALRRLRGAAIATAAVELESHKLHFAGVGNITGCLVSSTGKSQSLLSHNGIIGAQVHKLQQLEYQWNNGDLLIMHSDGMSARWKLSNYPGLMLADTGIIAAILYRDGKRGRDDTTVLVARLNAN